MIDMNDAEQFKRLFIDPTVEAIKAEITPLAAKLDDHESRLKKVESVSKYVSLVYSGIVGAGVWAWKHFTKSNGGQS